MSRKTADNRMTATQSRLHLLQNEIAAAGPQQTSHFLTELQIAVEELEVAHEELKQQNEEILSTREELEVQRHRYRDLFEHAPYGYLVTDVHGVIEEANQAAAALLGLDAWHLGGKPFLLFVAEEDRNALRSQIGRLRIGEPAADREVRLRSREDGQLRTVALTVVRDVDDSAKEQRLRWMLRDVSAAKATEEALRASEEKLRHSQRLESVGRLAGGIAHSFNNLLAAISFHGELLREHLGEDDPAHSHLLAIQGAGERAAALARQLLAFGRKQTLQPQVLCLGAVISGLEPILRRLLGEDVDVQVELDPQETLVDADPGQLEQVILNLVVNARDAMPYGGRLVLGTAQVELPAEGTGLDLPAGPYLKMWVADTGTGMSEEVRSRLFEPFFTTKEKNKGTGLGLATVHGIVHQSGGAITVESAPGKGSCFTIYLPRAEQGAAAVPIARPARLSSRELPRGSEVILLVEDEENIRTPAVEILESRGYTVLAAGDASEALETAAQHSEPIDLMITDVVMPGLSGGQLAERLAAQRPDLKVVYISGYPEDAIAHHGVLSPGKVFLQKPFSPAALLAKVRQVLDAVPATQD